MHRSSKWMLFEKEKGGDGYIFFSLKKMSSCPFLWIYIDIIRWASNLSVKTHNGSWDNVMELNKVYVCVGGEGYISGRLMYSLGDRKEIMHFQACLLSLVIGICCNRSLLAKKYTSFGRRPLGLGRVAPETNGNYIALLACKSVENWILFPKRPRSWRLVEK